MFHADADTALALSVAHAALATVTLWAVSAALSIALALMLAHGMHGSGPLVRRGAGAIVNATRGVPTSMLVLAAGMLAMASGGGLPVPAIFTGTIGPFQHVAWAIAAALALGSCGHLAVIFHAAYGALDAGRRDQLLLLAHHPVRKAAILLREVLGIVLPPTGARLVHHLHNTAFASLFPVAELFGLIRGQSEASAQVFLFAAVGALTYAGLSLGIWALVRGLEAALVPPVRTAEAAP
ncbi:MAG TPA: hypothetical protein VD995_00630 [Azospirillum sp.]|nr:hypothetical protein [Azospirillum sp.]